MAGKMVVSAVLLWLASSAYLLHGTTGRRLSVYKFSLGPPSHAACPSSKNVTLHVMNQLKEPFMNMSQAVIDTCEKFLLGVMQEAANASSSFRFTATYFNLELGFFVNAYNNVFANYSLDKSFWEILDGDGKPTELGVSSYVPTNGETVTFNLTQSSGH